MSDSFWSTRFRGTPIRIGLNDLSYRRMMEMSARFGESYGIPAEFTNLLLRGDMKAIACAVWIGQQKAGVEVCNLDDLDFNLEDDFEKLEDPKPKAKGKKANPTQEGDTPTPDSAPTASQNSETDTSSTSETSAD